MNVSEEINKLLNEYISGDKFLVYEKLNKIFKKNKNNNKLRFNIAVIQQQLKLNKESKRTFKFFLLLSFITSLILFTLLVNNEC